MRRQDLKIAVRMAVRYFDAQGEIQTGKIPKEILEEFPPDHLEEICVHVGLERDVGEELLALAMALRGELTEAGTRPPDPKPSKVGAEIDTIRKAAQSLEIRLRNASEAARDACTVCTHEQDGAGNPVIEFSEDPFKAASSALLQLIERLDSADLPTGEGGSPISPKRHALSVLRNIVIEATGKCTKDQLQFLAERILEPVLPNDDTTCWRGHIACVLPK